MASRWLRGYVYEIMNYMNSNTIKKVLLTKDGMFLSSNLELQNLSMLFTIYASETPDNVNFFFS